MNHKQVFNAIASLLIMALILNATPVCADDAFPIADLTGKWQGKSRCPFSRNNNSQDFLSQDSIDVTIEIHEDGSVTGSVADAMLKECRIAKNRGWLGRKLNMKTDFIIKSGYLSGKVLPVDPSDYKEFTLPFNITDENQMSGTVMILQGWKYPYPLTSRLKLSKNATSQPEK